MKTNSNREHSIISKDKNQLGVTVMVKKQRMTADGWMRLIRNIYILLALNISFCLSSFPFIAAVLFLAIDVRNLAPFIGAAVFIGPSLITLLAAWMDWKEQKDIDPFKTYMKRYLEFGRNGFCYWLLAIFLLLGVVGDFWLAEKIIFGKWVLVGGLSRFLFGTACSVILMYFRVNNPEKAFSELVKISSYLVLKRWYIAIFLFLVLMTALCLMVIKPPIGLLVTITPCVGLLFTNCAQLLCQNNKK